VEEVACTDIITNAILIKTILNLDERKFETILFTFLCPNDTKLASQLQTRIPTLPQNRSLISTQFWSWNSNKRPKSAVAFLGDRFLYFYQFLSEEARGFDHVLLVDAFDVRVYSDPFVTMAQFPEVEIFTQAEWRSNKLSPYMLSRYERCHYGLDKNILQRVNDRHILNCGIFGGKLRSVTLILQKMAEKYNRVLSTFFTSSDSAECVKLGMDMVMYNDILTESRLTIKENEPFAPVYRNCHFHYEIESRDTSNKTYSRNSCSQSEIRNIPVHVRSSPVDAENWVRSFCSSGKAQVVKCQTLPFSMIHKGEVVFANDGKSPKISMLPKGPHCPIAPDDKLSRKFAYSLTVPDSSYFLAALTTAFSLQRVKSKADIIIDYIESSTSEQYLLLEKARQLNITLRAVRPQSIPTVHTNFDYSRSVMKITVPWNMTEYDKVISLDTDNIVLKNIDHLFYCPDSSSVNHFEQLGKLRDLSKTSQECDETLPCSFESLQNCPSKIRGWYTSAMMVVKPDPSLIPKILNCKSKHINFISDMDYLNCFYSCKFVQLPVHYQNFDRPDLLPFSNITHVVHWSTGRKPFNKQYSRVLRGEVPWPKNSRMSDIWHEHYFAAGLDKLVRHPNWQWNTY
jgi:lipopolysaccharide biosynthesis glycosyltransferase